MQKVFHSFSVLRKKKPVEKVEKSVDNSKTSVCGIHPSQTLEIARRIFCQGFFEKTPKFFKKEKCRDFRAFATFFFLI